MTAIASTTGHLHCEFVRLLFLQTLRETDRFLTASGVQIVQTNFHFRRAVFSSQLKSKVRNTLVKAAPLRVNLNLDGASITSRTHTHPSHSQTSRLFNSNLVSICRCSSSPSNPVYARRIDSSTLVLVFHLTGTHIFVFSIDLALSIHNKQTVTNSSRHNQLKQVY